MARLTAIEIGAITIVTIVIMMILFALPPISQTTTQTTTQVSTQIITATQVVTQTITEQPVLYSCDLLTFSVSGNNHYHFYSTVNLSGFAVVLNSQLVAEITCS